MQRPFRKMCLATVLALVTTTPQLLAAPGEASVRTILGDSEMRLQVSGVARGGVLTVSGPSGSVQRLPFEGSEIPTLDLISATGEALADGHYTWELRLYPSSLTSRGVADAETRSEPRSSGASITSGYFTVENGSFVQPVASEGAAARPRVELETQDNPTRDNVISDDLIVDGSACVGQDCVNGESFGFDTLRLKENNLRIKFQDTSNSASFPTNDWQITANDSTNGGANKFSIDDIDNGRTPFTLEASAPSHSLYVDDGGRIGLGTSTPVVQAHMVDGNTPTLRLEQDGSSGFSAQTWDVAGNETNFFIRDATNGSTLPFRIFPSAPQNALVIAADGDIGMGTSAPAEGARLHIKASTSVGRIDSFLLENNAAVRLAFLNTAATHQRWTLNNKESFRFVPEEGLWAMRIHEDGVVEARSGFRVLGTDLDVPDYVFDPSYSLMPLDKLSEFIEQERHLPEVPSAAEVQSQGLDLTDMQLRLLKKVEELTLYTLQQQATIDQLQQRLEALEER